MTHSAKKAIQQKEHWGWGLEATGKRGRGGGWTKIEKWVGNVGGLHKVGVLRPLCQLCIYKGYCSCGLCYIGEIKGNVEVWWNEWSPSIIYCLPSYFQILCRPAPPLPGCCNPHPHPHCPFCCLGSLLEWVTVSLLNIWCIILLNDIMDLHMSSLGTFRPKGPYVYFMQ